MSIMQKSLVFLALFAFMTVAAHSEYLPACAKSSAATVMFNGKPALKLSDAAACPAGSFQIIPNMMIEGEPMVHFNAGAAGCTATTSPNVIANNKAANTVGDVACPQ